MLAVAAVPLTCWLCALLALPRPPRRGDEMQELVYCRLIARQHLLVGCAVLTTFAVALALAAQALTNGMRV